MARFEFSGNEVRTITHALEIVATRFDEDATIAREAGHPRLAEQFDRQAQDSRKLADKIERES